MFLRANNRTDGRTDGRTAPYHNTSKDGRIKMAVRLNRTQCYICKNLLFDFLYFSAHSSISIVKQNSLRKSSVVLSHQFSALYSHWITYTLRKYPAIWQSHHYTDGVMWKRCNSSVLAMELHLFCIKLSIHKTHDQNDCFSHGNGGKHRQWIELTLKLPHLLPVCSNIIPHCMQPVP